MPRTLLACTTATLLAATTAAQCFDQNQLGAYIGTTNYGTHTLFPGHYPLGFAFPMANSAGSGSWTHFQVCSKGWLVLTDGTNTSGIPTSNDPPNVTPGQASSLYGPVGSNPRIAPLWGPWSYFPGGVYYDSITTPGVCRITWFQAFHFDTPFTMQAELFANGTVRFHYSATAHAYSLVVAGLSAANGTGAQGGVDLAPGPNTSSVPGMHETFSYPPPPDLGNRTLTFTPIAGGWHQSVTCGSDAASHTPYGSGCHAIPATGVYQHFATAAQADAGASSRRLLFTPAGNSYQASWSYGPGFLPPDPWCDYVAVQPDGSAVVPLPAALPTPFGPVTALRVGENGIVHLGSAPSPHDGDHTPSGAEFAACPLPGFYAWHDFNDFENGDITTETVGSLFVVTFYLLESYANPETANPSNVQFLFHLTTGEVTLVLANLHPNSTSLRGSSYLIGAKGPGAVADAGSVNFAANPTASIRAVVVPAMTLSASPEPLSTLTTGTLVTYTHDHVPETTPGSGLRLGVTMLSLGQNLGGLDLGFLGLPGCAMHLQSLDSTLAFVGPGTAPSTTFQLPASVPYGTRMFAQSAALVAPGSLPNGQNAFGAVLSNAVASFVSYY